MILADLNLSLPSPVEQINLQALVGKDFMLSLKRDDLIHPIISGNKFRKLEGNILHFYENDFDGIVSFGGAYSNHLHALSYLCNVLEIPLIGMIRGEKPEKLSATLKDLIHWNTTLKFISREEYKLRNEPDYLAIIQQKYPRYFIIPEGGSNEYANYGLKNLCKELNSQTNHPRTIIIPIGSGGTLKGILANKETEDTILAISCLKGIDFYDYLSLEPRNDLQIITDYHFGGFAKSNADLDDFRKDFFDIYNIELDRVYNSKTMYATIDLIKQNVINSSQNLIYLMTGGIQGNRNL